jgi:hypothetical protein
MEITKESLKQRSTFHGACSLILTVSLACLQANVFPVEWMPMVNKVMVVLGILVSVNGGYDMLRDEKAPMATKANIPTGRSLGIFFIFVLMISMVMVTLNGCKWKELAQSTNEELKAEVCEKGEDSVILDLIPNASMVDVVLKAGNYAALKNECYTRQQIEKVFDECEKYLENYDTEITGTQVVAYISKKVKWVRENVDQDILFISQYATNIDVPRIFTTCDRRILLKEITKHREQVLVFY